MKKIHLFKCILYVCLTLSISNIYAQTAKEVVKGMGPGFDLGNVFENGLKPTTFSSVKPIIDSYVAAGMTNIRIPTTWYDFVGGTRLTDVNGNINTTHPRFIELVATIDYALSKGLYVLINTHHEHWLKDHYDGSAYYNNIFSNLWTNIGNHFKNYPNKLLFEVLNEPEGVMGQWETPILPTDTNAIRLTRQINKVGYDAIRATGGNNVTRIVMISPNGQANDSQIEEVYPNVTYLPGGGADKYLTMHVHSYDPWGFCGQTGTNASYPGAARIISDITVCNTHAQNNLGGIALHYGEFGVGRITNQAERSAAVVTEYYQTFAKTCIDLSIAFSVWDDRGWFSLINDAGTAFTYNIVPNMLSVINRAPSVSITSPIANASFSSGTAITIAATASDVAPGTVSSVSFYDGTTLLSTDVTSPYSFSWTGASVGSHSITAKAIDNNGAATTSTAVAITVTNIAPSVSITSPLANASFASGTAITIAATASDVAPGTISSVSFYDGITLLGTDITSPYSFSWTGASVGSHSITAKATDNNGAVTTSTAVAITVTNLAPSVSITSPTSGSSFTSGTAIALAAAASDVAPGTVSSVSFYDGATLIGSDAVSPYTFSWIGVSVGSHSITAKAIDNDGAITTSAAVTITVAAVNTPPSVSITSPTSGSSFTSGTTIALAATASDVAPGTVSSVSFYDGTTLLGTDITSPYSFSWTSASEGSHSITAKATDNNGAVTTSAAVAITVTADRLTLSYFHLINRWTADYMRPTAGGLTAVITQYEESAGTIPTLDSYEWEFKKVTGTSYYYIINRYTQKAIQPTGGSINDNVGLSQTTLTASNEGLTELHWSITLSNEAPYYWIMNRKSGRYIRPNAGTSGTGVAIVQNTFNATYSSFKWNLDSQSVKPVAPVALKATTETAAINITKEETTKVGGVYPNPAKDIIYVNTEVEQTSTVNVVIYNVSGAVVLSKEYKNRIGWFAEQFDISHLTSGTYVVKIQKGEITETKKIVKD